MSSTIDLQVAEGDRVATQWTSIGTNNGKSLGMPPTGRECTLKGLTIDRIVGGKIVETWTAFDQLGSMQQLGAMPARK